MTPLVALIDVTVVLAGALLASALLTQRAAALRHAILAAALAAAALAPALEALVPQWELPLAWAVADVTSSGLTFSSEAPDASTAVAAVPIDAAPRVRWAGVFLLVWAAGALGGLTALVIGFVRLVVASRRCARVTSGPWRTLADELTVRRRTWRPAVLLQSADVAAPLTWGFWRPRIVLPASADAWDPQRRTVVLAHELAHIRRGDWLLQIAAELLRAIYWFHPLVWIAVRRLRDESEFACDDAVLDDGVEAADYASHLLEVARHAAGRSGAWASAPAVASPSTLERRISVMLNRPRTRLPLARRTPLLAAIATAVMAVPVAALSIAGESADTPVAVARHDVALTPAPVVETAAPRAARDEARVAEAAPAAVQQAPATVSGIITDQTGAVLPGVELRLTDTQVGVLFTAVTDGTGRFAFNELQPGRYELVSRLPGFRIVSNILVLASGANVQRRLTMSVGSLEETVTVVCSPGRAAANSADGILAFGSRRPESSLSAQPRGWTRPTPPPAPPAFTPQDPAASPVRVGGQIKAPRRVTDVKPICPQVIPAPNTLVILSGRIGVDGYMNSLTPVSRQGVETPRPEFVDSAIEAARQWTFTPTLLNNSPVEVDITITVRFSAT